MNEVARDIRIKIHLILSISWTFGKERYFACFLLLLFVSFQFYRDTIDILP